MKIEVRICVFLILFIGHNTLRGDVIVSPYSRDGVTCSAELIGGLEKSLYQHASFLICIGTGIHFMAYPESEPEELAIEDIDLSWEIRLYLEKTKMKGFFIGMYNG